MYNGILLIDKQEGITSFDVIRKMKRLLPRKYKIGHGGTLDPFATGLLIVLLGKGTKQMNNIHALDKEYVVKAKFGYETDTQDLTGKTINESDTVVTQEQIENALPQFTGEISQMPPKYSAKRVKGKRAYDLAREGKEFELQPKQITVHNYEILDYSWPEVTLMATVSTGTYIRTLVVDLAKVLGTYATATELRRTRIGNFSVEDAFPSKNIDDLDIAERIIDLESLNL